MPQYTTTAQRIKFKTLFNGYADTWKCTNGFYSDESLAEALGVSRQTISAYRSGRQMPHLAMLETIAELFNVDINYFIYDPETDEHKYKATEKKLTEDVKNKEVNVDFLSFLLSTIPVETLFTTENKLKDIEPVYNLDGYGFIQDKIEESLFTFNVEPYKYYQMDENDIDFIKKLQDDVTEYIQYLLFKEQKERGESNG